MSRERPPRTDIPRNLSFISSLTERAYYRSQRPSLEEEPEEEPGEGGTRLGARSRAQASSRGRRARSAPAGGGGARASRSRSPDTRKRVRFADALGLELAAVRRFRPGELPRVPRHVHVQLQRDALPHFAPCQPRARGLQEARAALEPVREPGFAARLQAQRISLRGPEHPGSGGTPEPQGWIHFI
ncbi:PREDICTED: protein phosphatase 1 regulatory subunit 3E [Myotis davidii]|uniref:protein phosphatase 1 regulatory subunit 3E n=1 Tax=Myotis davidii TaxID=225400 RepID=UPI0003EC5E92|nr:PREDICTED: protein phosphatase 1 regulatory subunit 3E [Myotis davidii]